MPWHSSRRLAGFGWWTVSSIACTRGEADVDAAPAAVAVEVDLERVAVVDRAGPCRSRPGSAGPRRRAGTAPSGRRSAARPARGARRGRRRRAGRRRRRGIARVNSAPARRLRSAAWSDSGYAVAREAALEHRAERHPVRPRRVARRPAASPSSARVRIASCWATERRPGRPSAQQVLEPVQPRLEAVEHARQLGVRRTPRRRRRGSARRRRRRAAPSRVAQRARRTASLARAELPQVALAQLRDGELGRQPVHDREHREDVVDVGSRVIGATRVKRCGAISTSPSSRSRASASRTGVRLSPSQAQSSSSWSGSPGSSVPSTIASQSAS